MFDVERLTADCLQAVAIDSSHKAVREVLARTMSDPASVLRGLGEPQRAGITPIYRSDALTIINVVWGPGMSIMPHDHRTWAVIGVYSGREDNIFWRHIKGSDGLRTADGKALVVSRRAGGIGVAVRFDLGIGDLLRVGRRVRDDLLGAIGQVVFVPIEEHEVGPRRRRSGGRSDRERRAHDRLAGEAALGRVRDAGVGQDVAHGGADD